MDAATTTMSLLTASRLKAARGCKRLHHYLYEVGYRPVETAQVLRFGTLMHKGLEAWWRAAHAGLPEDVWLELAFAAVSTEADLFDLARAQVLLTGYHIRWKDEPYDVLSVEAQFEAPLINPTTGKASRTWRVAGKIDALVRDRRDGRVLLVEHKTTSASDFDGGSPYLQQLRIDSQVSTYYVGAAALGHEVAGCLYDIIGKPALRPSEVPLRDEAGVKIVHDATGNRVRTKDGKKWRETGDAKEGFTLQTRPETPEEFRERLAAAVMEDPNRYFQRADVVRLKAEMDEHLFEVWQQAKALREGELANFAPRNVDHCFKYGRPCPFWDVCSGGASLEDRTRFRKLESVHPELEAEAAHGA